MDDPWTEAKYQLGGPPQSYLSLSDPSPKSALRCGPYLRISGNQPPPNWFRRFWYWALLGWTWEKLDG